MEMADSYARGWHISGYHSTGSFVFLISAQLGYAFALCLLLGTTGWALFGHAGFCVPWDSE